jgi:hypothetical protein
MGKTTVAHRFRPTKHHLRRTILQISLIADTLMRFDSMAVFISFLQINVIGDLTENSPCECLFRNRRITLLVTTTENLRFLVFTHSIILTYIV